MTDERLAALRSAVEGSPDDHALRLVLAEALADADRPHDALAQYETVLDADALPAGDAIRVGTRAIHAGRLRLAARCLDLARHAGVVGGTAELERLVRSRLGDGPGDLAAHTSPRANTPDVARVIEVGPESRRFEDVGGLDDVKQTVHRTIILPYQRPDLYERYGRSAGGGVLLFGPPGCGKTLLARATAGECGTAFLNLRIEDVLDPGVGGTERRLHQAFCEARDAAPCVLFVDELDALAYARRKSGGRQRTIVDQLLQELDAIGSANAAVLILGATNAPWDVDDALLRPGRFDRAVFVPPPDPEARRRILALTLAQLPTAAIDLDAIVQATPLFSGADLRALVDRAVDGAIAETLRCGGDVPVTQQHLEHALHKLGPTTLAWLRTARNAVEFANEGGRYDAVREFLSRRESRAVLRH